ncbi:hypothetical protein [Aestuariivita sp.]|jgi:hypothetical protein|uniref:hypothetical protein n=1 Tax=Aestuariivita sp. TaxID=1872407 RepID=UPI002170D48F|nr:hypothetical protein [Aestuariivita sp.]MCE8007396.1 hypothetical protein [Aestuariivita sp.]
MSQCDLTKTRLANGVWEGVLTRNDGATDTPEIEVRHLDQIVPGVELAPQDDGRTWSLTIPVPAYAISDGIHTFTVIDTASETMLDHFTLIAGEVLADDMRGEMALLRAELDMLKRAFRRHCLEAG